MTTQEINLLIRGRSVTPAQRLRATECLDGGLYLFALSGKMASGKDTTAVAVAAELGGQWKHVSFATALKQEMNQLFQLVRTCPDDREATVRIAEAVRCTPVEAAQAVPVARQAVIEAAAAGLELTSTVRTAAVRRVLQIWGTEVRRASDEDYWVKATVPVIVDALESGQSVYVTDPRFTNEVDALVDLGGTVVRLDISPEVQAERLMARDGLLPAPAALLHRSENDVDDYPVFNLRIDVSDRRPLEAVSAEVAAVLRLTAEAARIRKQFNIPANIRWE